MTVPVITESSVFLDFCDAINKEKPAFMTVDTEFARQSTYYPELCLVQIATPNQAAIIDPLAKNMDLSPLKEIFQNQSITKIFHSGRQDLEIFWNVFKEVPCPVFDTQIAATFAGLGVGLSYDSLVQNLLGITIDKSSQHTNWAQRPLKDSQLTYALDDVLHLRAFYPILCQKLADLNRLQWVIEECRTLEDKNVYNTRLEHAWHRVAGSIKDWKVLSVLKDLAFWREEKAQAHNLPRAWLVEDKMLTSLSASPVTDIREFEDLFKKHRHEIKKLKLLPELFECLQNSRSLISEDSPDRESRKTQMQDEIKQFLRTPLSAKFRDQVEDLRDLLTQSSLESGLPQHLIASRHDIESFVKDQRADNPILQSWRYDVFGKAALKLLNSAGE
jgi:ribonuclease D